MEIEKILTPDSVQFFKLAVPDRLEQFINGHRESSTYVIDVINKICPGYNTECPVRTRVNDNKYCLSCDPDDSRRKRFKRYENAFFAYVHDKINIHQREFRVNFDANETAKTCARVDVFHGSV